MDNDSSQTPSGIRIEWKVPLTWLIGSLGIICGQAAIVYFSQIRLGEKFEEQNATIKDLTKQMREMNQLIGSTNIKDIEHDLKLSDHERRLQNLESRASQLTQSK
jgi:hypothetical protein